MTHDDTATTTAALRALDAAGQEPSRTQRIRAAATLERILSTDPGTPTPMAPPTRSRRRARRLTLAGGVLVAATAVTVVVPTLSDEGEAFASWSPTPVPLTGAERAAAVDACLVLQGNEGGELDFDPRSTASVLIAEARGGWSYVAFTVAGTSGTELQGSCLVPDDLVADPRPGEGGFFGSLDVAEDTTGTAPGRAVAREDSSGLGAVDDELFGYAEGRAGADVASIEVTTPAGLEVDASVSHGRWAVWWPAGDAAMDNPEVTDAPTYTVTLRDGTVTGLS